MLIKSRKNKLKEIRLRNLHFRLHPGFDESGILWVNQLSEHLEEQGIDVEILGCEIPIGKIACDYAWVAAPLSTALIDIGSVCKEVVPICFEAHSKLQCPHPKLTFGFSEGINWINEDGSYDPKIFETRQQFTKARKSVAEIVFDLSG